MFDLSKLINQSDFAAKLKAMHTAYNALEMIDIKGHEKFYGIDDRLEILDEVFDGQLIIDTCPSPQTDSKFVVIQATLLIATDAGLEPVCSRYGRASSGVLFSKKKAVQDLDKYASRAAIGSLLDVLGMPSMDIRDETVIGEYDILGERLEALGMTFETAVLGYNMHNKDVKTAAVINKKTISDLNVDELRRLLFSLPPVTEEEYE
jgi:hypothetical protein